MSSVFRIVLLAVGVCAPMNTRHVKEQHSEHLTKLVALFFFLGTYTMGTTTAITTIYKTCNTVILHLYGQGLVVVRWAVLGTLPVCVLGKNHTQYCIMIAREASIAGKNKNKTKELLVGSLYSLVQLLRALVYWPTSIRWQSLGVPVEESPL